MLSFSEIQVIAVKNTIVKQTGLVLARLYLCNRLRNKLISKARVSASTGYRLKHAFIGNGIGGTSYCIYQSVRIMTIDQCVLPL